MADSRRQIEDKKIEAVLERTAAAIEASHKAQVQLLEAVRLLVLASPPLQEKVSKPTYKESDPELAALDGDPLEGIPNQGVFTVSEVASLLKISRGAVYEAVRSRRLASLPLGKQIRIPRRGLIAFMHGMEVEEFEALIRRKADEHLSKR